MVYCYVFLLICIRHMSFMLSSLYPHLSTALYSRFARPDPLFPDPCVCKQIVCLLVKTALERLQTSLSWRQSKLSFYLPALVAPSHKCKSPLCRWHGYGPMPSQPLDIGHFVDERLDGHFSSLARSTKHPFISQKEKKKIKQSFIWLQYTFPVCGDLRQEL